MECVCSTSVLWVSYQVISLSLSLLCTFLFESVDCCLLGMPITFHTQFILISFRKNSMKCHSYPISTTVVALNEKTAYFTTPFKNCLFHNPIYYLKHPVSYSFKTIQTSDGYVFFFSYDKSNDLLPSHFVLSIIIWIGFFLFFQFYTINVLPKWCGR